MSGTTESVGVTTQTPNTGSASRSGTLWCHTARMQIHILYIDECPNWREAGVRMGAALTTVGAAVSAIDYQLLTDAAQLGALPFAGSPTILVDGVDLFPSDGATSDLACRVYVSNGRMAGLPTVDELVLALRARGAAHSAG